MYFGNYVTVDNPNIPVLTHTKPGTIEYGKFTETLIENFGQSNGSVIRMKDMYLPNFSLRVLDAHFSENVVFFNQHAHGTELLGSCVFFEGRVKSVLPHHRYSIDIFNRTHNFKYDPNNEFLHVVPAGAHLHFVHFSYTSEYLNHLLPEHEAWANTLKERVERKERIMGKQALPINLIQEQALQNIFNNPLTGKLGEMMLETSIIQILLLQLHALFGQNESLSVSQVSKKDLEIIYAVKDYLTQHFLEDHSMNSLAQHFAVNTNKLMFLFRKTFDKSIFEYLSELRMDHALWLLRDGELRIVDVARTLGYKNPNHFSTAFKRKFGVSPSEVK